MDFVERVSTKQEQINIAQGSTSSIRPSPQGNKIAQQLANANEAKFDMWKQLMGVQNINPVTGKTVELGKESQGLLEKVFGKEKAQLSSYREMAMFAIRAEMGCFAGSGIQKALQEQFRNSEPLSDADLHQMKEVITATINSANMEMIADALKCAHQEYAFMTTEKGLENLIHHNNRWENFCNELSQQSPSAPKTSFFPSQMGPKYGEQGGPSTSITFPGQPPPDIGTSYYGNTHTVAKA